VSTVAVRGAGWAVGVRPELERACPRVGDGRQRWWWSRSRRTRPTSITNGTAKLAGSAVLAAAAPAVVALPAVAAIVAARLAARSTLPTGAAIVAARLTARGTAVTPGLRANRHARGAL
jgi:hypothetical protein